MGTLKERIREKQELKKFQQIKLNQNIIRKT